MMGMSYPVREGTTRNAAAYWSDSSERSSRCGADRSTASMSEPVGPSSRDGRMNRAAAAELVNGAFDGTAIRGCQQARSTVAFLATAFRKGLRPVPELKFLTVTSSGQPNRLSVLDGRSDGQKPHASRGIS